MSRVLALLTATALLGGCFSHSSSRITKKVGAYAMIAGGVVIVSGILIGATQPPPNDLGLGAVIIGGPIVLGGGVLALTGWIGTRMHDSPEEIQQKQEREAAERAQLARDEAERLREQERASRESEARELVLRARLAAAAGDCTTVRLLGDRVQTLDPDVHATRFAVDAELQPCLAAP